MAPRLAIENESDESSYDDSERSSSPSQESQGFEYGRHDDRASKESFTGRFKRYVRRMLPGGRRSRGSIRDAPADPERGRGSREEEISGDEDEEYEPEEGEEEREYRGRRLSDAYRATETNADEPDSTDELSSGPLVHSRRSSRSSRRSRSGSSRRGRSASRGSSRGSVRSGAGVSIRQYYPEDEEPVPSDEEEELDGEEEEEEEFSEEEEEYEPEEGEELEDPEA